MAEIVNLRSERKRAKRRQAEVKAAANRVAHGLSKPERALAQSKRDQAARVLDGHRTGNSDDKTLDDKTLDNKAGDDR